MSLLSLAKTVEKFAVANSPAILTAIAVTGTVTTAVLAGKASFRAAQIIALAEEKPKDPFVEADGEEGEAPQKQELELKEKLKLVAPLYIPAVASGCSTIFAMITATQIGSRRAAAMAAAYSMSEKAFGEYREKIVEKIGPKKETAVRDELAQERVNRTPAPTNQVMMVAGEVLCFDQHSGRYFQSSMEELKKAQNDLNYKILSQSYVSLNDFYEHIGLEIIPTGEELGWTTEKKLELAFSAVLSTDQRPCIAIDFYNAPIPNYYKGH